MTLKDDLLCKGYLPENLPPMFVTQSIGTALANRTGWLSLEKKQSVRASPFNASKRGMTRRVFSFVHPATAHDLAKFISENENEIIQHFSKSSFSLSKPIYNSETDRAVSILSHADLERERFSRLARHRFIARTDISRFYHSIYTHSIPWALHGRELVKENRFAPQFSLGNQLDKIIQAGQYDQTIGIPVGPDASRYLAEIVATAIDDEFMQRGGSERCTIIRHVDDIWIGADTHVDAEQALWRYREAIRSFELDINETKTAIHSEDFCFSDIWPSDISSRIEFADQSSETRAPERLRAALEYAFAQAVFHKDDGILKYTIRYLDKAGITSTRWVIIEPFLRRVAIHFGHTIDYVSRIIVWRHLVHGDIDRSEWSLIFLAILERHGRLGNDAEVCWAIYAAIRIKFDIRIDISKEIIKNCNSISIVALLACVEEGLVNREIFEVAMERASIESARGLFWPLLLEWKSRRWAGHVKLKKDHALIQELARDSISILNTSRLPRVFENLQAIEGGTYGTNFAEILSAIEDGIGNYPDHEHHETVSHPDF